MESDWYVESADHGQRFDYQEFVERVAERENVDPSDDDRETLFELVGADEEAFGEPEQ